MFRDQRDFRAFVIKVVEEEKSGAGNPGKPVGDQIVRPDKKDTVRLLELYRGLKIPYSITRSVIIVSVRISVRYKLHFCVFPHFCHFRIFRTFTLGFSSEK